MTSFTVQMSTNSDEIRLYIVHAPEPAAAASYALRIAEEHDRGGSSWTVDMTFEGEVRPVTKGNWVNTIDLRFGAGIFPLGRGAGEVG